MVVQQREENGGRRNKNQHAKMKRIDNTGLVLEATLIVLPGNERSASLLNRPPPQFLFQLGSLDIHLASLCILLPEK